MATVKDCLELLFEETPRYEGAPIIAPYRRSTVVHYPPVQSARIAPAPQHLERDDEVRGIDGAFPALIDGYQPDGALSLRAYFNSLVFLLHACGLQDTITAGDGIITDPDGVAIPVGATRHVFAKRAGNVAKTMQATLCYADEGIFLRGQGYGVTSLSLNAAGALTADLMGLVLARIADPNITPVYDAAAILPARRGDFTIQQWLTGSGPTDDWTLNITNPMMRRSTLGLDPPSFFADRMEHGDERVQARGTIPKSIIDADDFDRLLDAGTFAIKTRHKTTKSIAATAYKYSMWFEAPAVQYTGGGPDELANRRRFGGNFDWVARVDETAGYDFKITIVNSVPALETYV